MPQLFLLEKHEHGQFVFQAPGRALELVPTPPLDEAANPYRGIGFREEDRALFFGRTAATAKLVEAVTARQLTAVIGPSGTAPGAAPRSRRRSRTAAA